MDKRFALPFCWIVLAVVIAITGQLWPAPVVSSEQLRSTLDKAGGMEVLYLAASSRAVLDPWAGPLAFGVLFAVITAINARYVRWLAWTQLAAFAAGWLLLFSLPRVSAPAVAAMFGLSDADIFSALRTTQTLGYALEGVSSACFVIVAALVIGALLRRSRPSS